MNQSQIESLLQASSSSEPRRRKEPLCHDAFQEEQHRQTRRDFTTQKPWHRVRRSERWSSGCQRLPFRLELTFSTIDGFADPPVTPDEHITELELYDSWVHPALPRTVLERADRMTGSAPSMSELSARQAVAEAAFHVLTLIQAYRRLHPAIYGSPTHVPRPRSALRKVPLPRRR